MKKAWLSGAVLAAILTAGTAHAAITVVGSGFARGCYLAAVHERADRDSIQTCDNALTRQPLDRTNRAATYVNRGIVYLNRHDAARALEDFDRAVELAPDLAEVHTNRAAALLEGGDFRGAVAAVDRGIALGPEEPHKAYFIRAAAYEELGDTSAAYSDYRRAVELAPDWRPARMELTRFSTR